MAINVRGSTFPYNSTAFGTIRLDADGDNIADTLDSLGNNVFTSLVDPDDPDGGAGGVAWDAPQVWADYETASDFHVGTIDNGHVEINQGSALRLRHAIIGKDSQGVLGVTGFDSTLNLDPDEIPGTFRTALAAGIQGVGSDPTQQSYWANFDPAAIVYDNGGSGDNGLKQVMESVTSTIARELGDYDLTVGQNAPGSVYIDKGGRIEVANRLIVAESAAGHVSIDGEGSFLRIGARYEREGGSSPPSSIINAGGLLELSNGGNLTIQETQGLDVQGELIVTQGSAIITGNLSVTADGIIRVAEGATLVVDGNLDNQATVLLDAGAHLRVTGTISGDTPKQALCGRATVIDGIPDEERIK